MELKPGYKQTEVGVIPEDWLATTIGDISATASGTTPPRVLADRYFRNGTIPWVKTLDLNNGKIHSTDEYITAPALKETCLKLFPKNTVLVAMYGGYAQIGRTGLLTTPATVNQALTAILPDVRKASAGYLLYTLNHRVGYWRSVASSSRKDPNITGGDVRAFALALPSVHEQQAIAEALSDADALIESLKQLLTKKRQLKQGAMQELLTGKQRIPGFNGKWEMISVGDIAEVKTGPFGSSLHESDYVESGTPIITVEHLGEFGVTRQNLPLISDEDRTRLAAYSLKKGDIVFSRVGSVDRNSLIREEQEGWLFSGRLLRVRPNQEVVYSPYLSFQFHTEQFKSSVLKVAVGQTMASLNTEILKGLNVVLPGFAEQTAIASFLSEMDNEIITLETQLQKARLIKQGMMQELLTGRIRLV